MALFGKYRKSVFAWADKLDFTQREEANGLPPGILTAIVRQESFGDPNAHSPAGARGIFQIMPRVAAHYHRSAKNPEEALEIAASELAKSYKRYDGNLDKMLAAYNFGSGNLRRVLDRHEAEERDARKHGRTLSHRWQDDLPLETRAYIAHIRADMRVDAKANDLYDDHHTDTPGKAFHQALTQDKNVVRRLQRRFTKLGYDVGEDDGDPGKKFNAAVAAFEKRMVDSGVILSNEKFKQDGHLDFASLNTLLCRIPGIYNKVQNPPKRS
jgi:hypothetical protein